VENLGGRSSSQSALGILNQMAGISCPVFNASPFGWWLRWRSLALSGSAIAWPRIFLHWYFRPPWSTPTSRRYCRRACFTTDQWADYLIYLHPEQKVFVDGRSDFYGPEIGDQFLLVMRGMPGWEKVIEKYGFNLALLPVDTAAAQLLKLRPEWRVVADDVRKYS